MQRNNELVLTDAELLYTNFSGRIGQYNRDGKRYFNVYVDDPEIVNKLTEDGWRVSIRTPKTPDEPIRHSIKVMVSYQFEPFPVIIRVVNGAEYYLDETTVGQLDKDRILKALVKVHGSGKKNSPDGKFTAYLDKMVVECEEDPFDTEYRRMFGEDPVVKSEIV